MQPSMEVQISFPSAHWVGMDTFSSGPIHVMDFADDQLPDEEYVPQLVEPPLCALIGEEASKIAKTKKVAFRVIVIATSKRV